MASITKNNLPSSLAPRIIRLDRQDPEMATRKVNSKELFGDSQSLLIEHEGTTYCLRATKFGKLLITK
ncbi:hemin uptake protein HemP [Polynucleobacter sp. 31A-FELB]|jgi:hemin uptake protein HemP|uniref:hemin uptake protein HemP n=1 Tax=Polynucleobacter sp. 31A-FELB TaxID=2689096 RepID=UPI001C0AE5EB|nr:hemin uptake protein HemP [Polynucleobacter sp. 31A-FELB]